MTTALHDAVYLVAALPALVVARRYRELPRIVPISARPNGPPIAHGPRWLLIVPALLIAVLLPLTALTLRVPGLARSEAELTLLYLVLIELGIFVALVLGLEAEAVVGKLRRFPAIVPYVAAAIIAATVVLAVGSA